MLARRGAVDHDPQRHRGDQDRREPRWHVLLGDRHEPVAAGGEQGADDGARQQLAPAGAQGAPAAKERQHQHAGGQEARAGAVQRRDGPHEHSDRQVRRAPDEVDRRQVRPDRDAAGEGTGGVA